MARNRSERDIFADMVRVAKEGAKKTHIMYKANLSYQLLHKYLDKLLELGLLESRSNMFRATKMGVRFLDSYDTYAKVERELASAINSKRAELDRILEEAERPPVSRQAQPENLQERSNGAVRAQKTR